MDPNKTEQDKEIAAAILLAKLQAEGAVCSTVSDGHLILLTRKFLQAMLDAHPTQDQFTIFMKRPDFKSAS